MTLLKNGISLIAVISFTVFISGCGKGEPIDNAEEYISTVDTMDIPDDVEVIGLGEATHGNVEFQELKQQVFETVVKRENVRVFVLEGDFGGGQQINNYILNGEGSAEAAVNSLDYSIYKTEQMVDLVEWMHEYNKSVNDDEKIRFYGNDMQRYDLSKKGLLDYFAVVDKEAANQYSDQLKHVSNETMRDLTTEQLEKVDETIDDILQDLQSNEAKYLEHSSSDEFAFATAYAQNMKQRTQLFLTEENYTHLRDQYLAENLQWIMGYEKERGNEKVFFSGHNGHVEKTSASPAGYKSMGNYLDEVFGTKYFAIGTDFINSKFQAKNGGSGNRKMFTVKNHNDLVDAFSEIEQNNFYVDFDKSLESDELSEIISSEQKMANIGDDFQTWYKVLKMFYTIEMVPDQAYDGVIIVKDASPTEVME
ncbi:erythromycin esterase family protein [Metabacillus sp. B2-18]|uniref:erythromycin esterase family protein n=1 Tax=Metabacillus sp. B2-18 TaxID=2897333 RepID=UPI001E28F620|nr:erythromycin esterase family protein [Metabacillus sp. B2-18]UGB33187.1 erythromycin esterase family protein [Metabacillus sp. B2-18]